MKKFKLVDKNLKKIIEENCKEYGECIKTVYSDVKRIIALGDIHGDLKLAKKLLQIAKVIDDNNNWIGKDTFVVQIGDQIDSHRPQKNNIEKKKDYADDINVLKFFTKLHKEATKDNGAVISLLGNHELMNVMGDMRYVSHNNISCFSNNCCYDDGINNRINKFKVGNEYSKFLGCTRMSAVIINDILFVHAGILPEFAKKNDILNRDNLDEFNNCIKLWLLGEKDFEDVNQIVIDMKSLFWNRIYGNIPPKTNAPLCSHFYEAMKYYKISHMVIGHSPQSFLHKSKINSTCKDKIWRIDAGSSYAFDTFNDSIDKNRKPQLLEIKKNDYGNHDFKLLE